MGEAIEAQGFARLAWCWFKRERDFVGHPMGHGMITPTRGPLRGTAMRTRSELAFALGWVAPGHDEEISSPTRTVAIAQLHEDSPEECDEPGYRRDSLLPLRAPFPWMGGKSRGVPPIWEAFGPDIVNYVEPFAGSLAVVLGRPGGAGKIETVNDLDGGICNFWRAVKANPDAVAEWCDDPVSELDLHARHAWLVARLEEMAEQLRADPEYFDAKVAGWWVWGICQWIGTGWCGGIKHGEPRPNLNSGQGVHALGNAAHQKRPETSGTNAGKGIHAPGVGTRELPHQRPHVSGDSAGMGVLSKKMPNLSGFEVGVRTPRLQHKMPLIGLPGCATTVETGKGALSESAQRRYGLPAIGNDRGINGVSAPPCLEWFRALQNRLRRVRVVCGDWTRVLGPSVLGKGKTVGGRRPCAVYLDPPYDVNMRAKRIYNHDAAGLAAAVREWAIAHGDDPDLRICLSGYYEEHATHMPASWRVVRWKGARGYAGEDNDNREEETHWFSPHCLGAAKPAQGSLFT